MLVTVPSTLTTLAPHPGRSPAGLLAGCISSQTQLGASSKESMVEVNVTALEKDKEGAYFLVVGDVVN